MINIITLLTLLLDGILSNYISYSFNNISYFFPLLTLSILPIIYPYIKINKYFTYIIITGIIYDLMYSNIFLLNTMVFIIISLLVEKYYKYLVNNYLSTLILLIINIVTYDFILFFITYILGNHTINIDDLFYKIEHSIILNLGYGLIIYYLLRRLFEKKIIKRYVK